MTTDWARRFLAWPHALTAAGTVLAVASAAQAASVVAVVPTIQKHAVPAVAHAPSPPGTSTPAGAAVLYVLPLCLLALAGTVPLIFLSRTGAAVAITAVSVLSLAAFGLVRLDGTTLGLLTAGGAVAQVIAVCRLGAAASRSGRYLALSLSLPFGVLALASRGGPASVLLASAVPIAAGAGIAARARRVADRSDTARTALADSLVENMARGERARIARELHDIVAHHISVISVQAETARLAVPGLSADGAERFREISDTARAGLTEMRRLLGVLRPDVAEADIGERQPQPGLPQIASLVEAARVHSGGPVRLIVSGAVTSYEPGVELAAYRIVQEALTNARRHAPGAAVDVELRYEPGRLRMRVRDNGPGPGSGLGSGSGLGAGHGLLGMRERAGTVGGCLRTGEAPGGGFVVEAELPARRHDRAEAL